MELLISDKQKDVSDTLLLIAKYLGKDTQIKVTTSQQETVELLTSNNRDNNWYTIAESISENASNYHKILFGNSEEETKTIKNFLEGIKSIESSKLLNYLNTYLEDHTFIIDHHISVCDFKVLPPVIRQLQQVTDEKKKELCHVTRYANHLQNLDRLNTILEISKLKFTMPSINKPKSTETVKTEEPNKKDKKDKKKKEPNQTVEGKKEEVKNEDQKSKGKKGDKTVAGERDGTKEKKEELKEQKKEEQPKIQEKKPKEKPTQEQQEEKKADEKQGKKKQPDNKKKDEEDLHPISKLDIRVGKVVKIYTNSGTDKLYYEEIDIGGEVRHIASGLKKVVPIETLQDSLVIVICNLKARKVGDI